MPETGRDCAACSNSATVAVDDDGDELETEVVCVGVGLFGSSTPSSPVGEATGVISAIFNYYKYERVKPSVLQRLQQKLSNQRLMI